MTQGIESVELTDAFVSGLLHQYVEAREDESIAAERKGRLGELIKHYLETHPDEVAWDGERKIEGRLQQRTNTVYDLVSLKRNDPALYQRLEELGCLTVNAAAAKAQKAQLGGLDRYAMPGVGSTALQVEVKK